ncbi:MAG: hypothetical protein OYG32_07350 [Rhodospirillaceae bacterium]|nr:hypothetical protein [Rhodospirillaceae bacterium]
MTDIEVPAGDLDVHTGIPAVETRPVKTVSAKFFGITVRRCPLRARSCRSFGSPAPATLDRGRNPQHFPVFGDSATREVVTLGAQQPRDSGVRKRGRFPVDQVAQPLSNRACGIGGSAVQRADPRGKEEFQREDALGRRGELFVHRPAYGAFVEVGCAGDVLAGHRPEPHGPVLQEFLLASENLDAQAQDGRPASFDRLEEPVRFVGPFPEICFFVLSPRLRAQPFQAGAVEGEAGRCIRIDCDNPRAEPAGMVTVAAERIGRRADDQVRHDRRRGDARQGQARPWIERAETVEKARQVAGFDASGGGKGLRAAFGQQRQLVQQRVHRRIERVGVQELQAQAFAQVPGKEAGRSQSLQPSQDVGDQRLRHTAKGGDVAGVAREISCLVEQAAQIDCDRALNRIGERKRNIFEEDILKRSFRHRIRPVGAVRIYLRTMAVSAGRRARRSAEQPGGFRRRPIPGRRIARRRLYPAGRRVIGRFVQRQQRIGLERFTDDGIKLETGQLQQFDRLL